MPRNDGPILEMRTIKTKEGRWSVEYRVDKQWFRNPVTYPDHAAALAALAGTKLADFGREEFGLAPAPLLYLGRSPRGMEDPVMRAFAYAVISGVTALAAQEAEYARNEPVLATLEALRKLRRVLALEQTSLEDVVS
ncbi:MAG: hypothetical protein H6Q90_505 [Deltaproteobacteria bacterium]|nr:hypothetical protein [Deltaproteobacteria bacterium]